MISLDERAQQVGPVAAFIDLYGADALVVTTPGGMGAAEKLVLAWSGGACTITDQKSRKDGRVSGRIEIRP